MDDKSIGTLSTISIVAFALSIDGGVALFDIFYAIPVVGWLLGFVIGLFLNVLGGVFLFCWFYYLGVPFAGKMGVASIVELIPVINVLPGWTAATVWTILSANNVGLGQLLGMIGMSTGVGAIAKGATATRAAAGAAAMRGASTETPQVIRNQSIPEGNDPVVRNTQNLKNPRFLAPNENPVKREVPNDGLLVRREREQTA